MTSSVSTQISSMDKENLQQAESSNSKSSLTIHSKVLQEYIDLEDPYDLERLKSWCQAQWFSTFRKVFYNRNLIAYHTCCNSFSRRRLWKRSGHPVDQTICLMKVPSFKNLTNEDEFFRWLLKIAKENARYGQKTLFPSMNRPHPDFSDTDEDPTMDTEGDKLLKKRCFDLHKELEDQKRLVKDLLVENHRLLSSSKAWHSRYQELLEQHDTTVDFFATPSKKHITNSPVFHYN